MATLFLHFNAPLPNNQQSEIMKNLKILGFSTERVFQDGQYIKWHYRGRLPNFDLVDDVKGKYFLAVKDFDKEIFKKINFIEFDLYFERKDKNEN